MMMEPAVTSDAALVAANDGDSLAIANVQLVNEAAELASRTVRLQIDIPNGKSVDYEISSKDQVSAAHLFLASSPEACYYTCYHLSMNNTPLNQFAPFELYNAFQECQNITLDLVPDLYDEASVKVHVRRLRDILAKPPMHVDMSVELYPEMSTPTPAAPTPVATVATVADATNEISEETKDSKNQSQAAPAQFSSSLSGFYDNRVQPRRAAGGGGDTVDHIKCLKNISISAWNPPPGNRQLHGDLLYLEIVTLEGNELHITGAYDGFYLNKCTATKFNPKPADTPYKSHTLVDLLKQASPAFNEKFGKAFRKMSKRHPYEILPLTVQWQPWIVQQETHHPDMDRAEDSMLYLFGKEDKYSNFDWNFAYQEVHELPFALPEHRTSRERQRFQIYGDFLIAAVKGAKAVVNGQIQPVNIGDVPRAFAYHYNNIFYSFATDPRGLYDHVGGDDAAHVMANHDFNGVKILNELNIPKLHVLLQCLVSYRGYRVVCQSTMPGVFAEKSAKLVTGSIDNLKTYLFDEEFHKLLLEASRSLHLKEHTIYNNPSASLAIAPPLAGDSDNNSKQAYKVALSAEMKGMLGFDNRYYLLECHRLFPRDLNEPSFYNNITAFCRRELIDKFAVFKAYHYADLLLKAEAEQTTMVSDDEKTEKQAMSQKDAAVFQDAKLPEKLSRDDILKKLQSHPTQISPENLDQLANNIAMQLETSRHRKLVTACLHRIHFNCDIDTNIQLADSADVVADDQKLLKEVAEYQLHNIQRTLGYWVSFQEQPCDSASLTKAMHSRGINMRYLGKLAQLCETQMHVMKEHENKVPAAVDGKTQDLKQEVESTSTLVELEDAELGAATGKSSEETKHEVPTPVRLSDRVNVEYVHRLLVNEMVIRTAKQLLNKEMMRRHPLLGQNQQSSGGASSDKKDDSLIGPCIIQFLNSLLGKNACGFGLSDDHLNAAVKVVAQMRVDEKKEKKKTEVRYADGHKAPFSPLHPANLWQRIRQLAKKKFFGYDLGERLHLIFSRKRAILRSLCLALGIQLLCRDYQLDDNTEEPFAISDLVDLQPVYKSNHIIAQDAQEYFNSALWNKRMKEFHNGFYCVNLGIQAIEQINGPMVGEYADGCRLQAELISENAGSVDPSFWELAIEAMKRCLLINQRVRGLDHYETARSHSYLAYLLYCREELNGALNHAERALYIYDLIAGPDHPSTILCHINVAMVYHSLRHSEKMLLHVHEALKRIRSSNLIGMNHEWVATCYHVQAFAYFNIGYYRNAVNFEKKAKTIWVQLFGNESDRSKDSATHLNTFTALAVLQAKHGKGIVHRETNIMRLYGYWCHIPAIGLPAVIEQQLSFLNTQLKYEQESERARESQEMSSSITIKVDENLDIKQPKLSAKDRKRNQQATTGLQPHSSAKIYEEKVEMTGEVPSSTNNGNHANNDAAANKKTQNSKKKKKKKSKPTAAAGSATQSATADAKEVVA